MQSKNEENVKALDKSVKKHQMTKVKLSTRKNMTHMVFKKVKVKGPVDPNQRLVK